MNPLEELKWNVDYARQDQIDRLNAYLDEGQPLLNFTHDVREWQLAALIRECERLIPQIQYMQEKKPNKLLFWKKK